MSRSEPSGDRPLNTGVALILFRRPEQTARVFERIREARPPMFFLIADGPREGVADDERECEAARAVVQRVDWPCEVIRCYANGNLGLKARVSTGLDRVFEQVDRAVILEDDCLPHPAFFRWCEELLERYEGDERVLHLSGSRLLPDGPDNGASYHFSRYAHVWGWATWRRAWHLYDDELTDWHRESEPEREARLRAMFSEESERRYWRYVWDNSEEIDNWDGLWSYALLSRNRLAANPNTNLISNIGYGEAATSAIEDPLGFAARPLEGMRFPLIHPRSVERDEEVDARMSVLSYRRSGPPTPPRAPLRTRIWHRALRAGGRALDFIPEPIRPRIRHRDRRSRDALR
jgi:hypothetical protein